jgi:exodeoxyribonuclease V alpha subunit
VGRLARAVRAGDAAGTLAVLASAPPDVAWERTLEPRRAVELALAGFAPLFDAVAAGAEPQACFAALERFRVLCASRVGPLGTLAINRAVVSHLQAAGRVPRGARHFVGQPVMVTRNDYGLRLYNGDVGLVMPDAAGGIGVAFALDGGGHRMIAPARLPEHETVYAMTVHKAQGSELERALVVPLAERAGLVTRELVYTAVTRVRAGVTVMASREALTTAVESVAARDSGLEMRLKARVGGP